MFANKIYLSALVLTLGFNTATFAAASGEESEVEPQVIRTEKVLELNKPEIDVDEIAPGLIKKTYKVLTENGPVTAYFLEADKEYYSLLPALDRDLIPGRDVVSKIAEEHGAVAAINASYFAFNGEILGVTRINGQTAGTTYFRRSALGIRPDGSAHIGEISYDGYVTLGGVTLSVSGVDSECGENGTVIYNKFYGSHTNTNIYVTCYVVKNNKVEYIQQGNTEIPQDDGVVIAAHGTSKEAFKDVQIGDDAIVFEHLGEEWSNDLHILGAGPRLIQDGEIHVTSLEEEFPKDIRVGRNPRTGFAITREGNYLFGVVDGRQPEHSVGCTLEDFAKMFLHMGAMDAINFDGGASSVMIINAETVNSPSAGKERNVGDALLLMNR